MDYTHISPLGEFGKIIHWLAIFTHSTKHTNPLLPASQIYCTHIVRVHHILNPCGKRELQSCQQQCTFEPLIRLGRPLAAILGTQLIKKTICEMKKQIRMRVKDWPSGAEEEKRLLYLHPKLSPGLVPL